jgi:hypothetical protein
MAITLVRTVQRVETYPAVEPQQEEETTYPTLMVVYNDTFDDPDDAQLPVVATKVVHLKQGDDISGEDQLVQDIANAIWS